MREMRGLPIPPRHETYKARILAALANGRWLRTYLRDRAWA